jgi:hypothetical protein
MSHNPHDAIDYILKNSKRFAKAKAERIYLEEFRKSKKALLMSVCTEPTAVAREQWAYSHPDYITLLDGIRAAVEVEEQLRWELIAAQARVEVWRSENASNRFIDKATT